MRFCWVCPVTPIPVAAEEAPLAPEVQRRVAVVVLARRIRGYAAMAKASSDCQVERGVFRREARQALAIPRGVGHQLARADEPLVAAAGPRLQRLDDCVLDPTKEAEALQLAERT